MKVHLLEECIDRFLTAQVKYKHTGWYYPHAMVLRFHDHWSAPQPAGLPEMYDLCLWSEYSQRWWKRENHYAKEIMISLIEADPELAAISWKDLANDGSSLEGRLSRFEYYCNELLQIHRQKHPGAVESYHHQDATILSLYLAGLFPDKYALYPGLDVFRRFCQAIGSPDIPKVDDLVRYVKVASIVFTFLQRNHLFERLKEQRADEKHKIHMVPFQLSYEIIFAVGNPDQTFDYGF